MSYELGVEASKGNLEKVKELYKPGEEVALAMGLATEYGHVGVLKYLALEGETAPDYKKGLLESLFYASQNGHIEIVEFLISKKAHKEEKSNVRRTALHAAATTGNNDIILKLLEAGMDVDILDQDGCTPLKEAVGSRRLETVKLLLDKSADPLKDDNYGDNPWDMAIRSEKEELKKLINNSFPEDRRVPL